MIEQALVDPEVVVFMDNGGDLRRLQQGFKAGDDGLWITGEFGARLSHRFLTLSNQRGWFHFRSEIGLRDVRLQILDGGRRVFDPTGLAKRKDRIEALTVISQPFLQVSQELLARGGFFQGRDYLARGVFG